MSSKRRGGRPIGETIGGILVGFDHQIMRTTPPPHELVHKGAPVRGLSGQDGDDLVIHLVAQGAAMPSFATSADGTTIAFDRLGAGDPVILVGGLLSSRHGAGAMPATLAAALPDRSVITYDRRGRGDSGDTAPYAVEREIEDLIAVIEATGGTADVYGHSSGAGLALRAAAAGAPIRRLVLYEPPWGSDDPDDRRHARELAAAVGAAIDDGRPADAIRIFMGSIGMPDDVVEGIAADPASLALARTMPYDHAVMDDADGGSIPVDVVRAVRVPTLVITGGASQPFFAATATRLGELLADGSTTVLAGQDHAADPDVLVPVVAAFLREGD